MIDSMQSLLPTDWAGIAPVLGDVAPWGQAVVAFVLGWTISRFSRRRVSRARSAEHLPTIPGYRAAQAAFSRELDRVRRYDRSMAVLVLKLEDLRAQDGTGGAAGSNGNGSPEAGEALLGAARQIMFWNIGYALADLLRETDCAASDVANRRYVVMLPEADDDLASLAAGRIERGLLACTGAKVRIGVSIYRADGLTIVDLVRAATEKCDRGATPRTAPRVMRVARIRSPRISDSRF